jgi:hypothetical protein
LKTIHYPVLVHSCKIQPIIRTADSLKIDERYVEKIRSHKEKDLGKIPGLTKKESWDAVVDREVIDGIDYYPLPKSCRCRRYVTYYRADEFISIGKALRIVRYKNGRVIKDEDRIWLPVVREKVPRIDLVTAADIQRANYGSERQSNVYIYNPRKKKFEFHINFIFDGISEENFVADSLAEEKAWAEAVCAAITEREDEDKFERRIRKQYREYIQYCHEIAMTFRKKLIVPFQPDPFHGRTLFTFGRDQRTVGGFTIDNTSD